jgi:serine/threonine protein kinase
MPPEYTKDGFISMKFDVYSLGVIILKIMAGNIGYTRCNELPHEEFVELVSTKLLSCVSLSLSLSV